MKAMRDALVQIIHLTLDTDDDEGVAWNEAISEKVRWLANEVIDMPPRACDVMSEEDLTKVVISGFMKSMESHPEFYNVGPKTLIEVAVTVAIKCAYDTKLASKEKGASDESK